MSKNRFAQQIQYLIRFSEVTSQSQDITTGCLRTAPPKNHFARNVYHFAFNFRVIISECLWIQWVSFSKNYGKSHVHIHFYCHIDAIIKWFAFNLIRLSLYWFSYWFLQCDYDVNVICSILKDNDVEWLSKNSITWIDLSIIVGLTCPRYPRSFCGEIEGIFGTAFLNFWIEKKNPKQTFYIMKSLVWSNYSHKSISYITIHTSCWQHAIISAFKNSTSHNQTLA